MKYAALPYVGKLSVGGCFVGGFLSLLGSEEGKLNYSILKCIISQIHTEEQFKIVSQQKWNVQSTL